MIPIFDSLAHPTVNGTWLGGNRPARVEELVSEMETAGFPGACAVGLAGQDGYTHEGFLALCRRYPNLTPVAGVDLATTDALLRDLDRVRELGFGAIKVHPRLSKATRALERLDRVLAEATARGLVVFYCTYAHGPAADYPLKDPLYALAESLGVTPEARVILMHGGDVNLLRYAELVRFNPNLLLDLSLTIMKYRGSSLDQDIAFLFREFDRRVCIGTDFPEYRPGQLRTRFDALIPGIPDEKARNIAHANLQRFLAP